MEILEQELLSKKELLELTDITYGQLYRWKRKNLIPEDWFIRKSTFTGQETFFPREKILQRIAKIKDMKEDISLDDLADVLSVNLIEVMLVKQEILDLKIANKITLDTFTEIYGDSDKFSFDKILCVYVLDKLLSRGEINIDEGKNLLKFMMMSYKKFEGKHSELLLIRKMGLSTFILSLCPNEIYFEENTKIVLRIDMLSYIEELKVKIGTM